MTLYKVTTQDGTALLGKGRWRKGRWRSVRGPLVPCRNGLHLCRADQLVYWLGPVIWEAEVDGEIIDAGDKVVARRARVIRRLDSWNERTARRFAADCAEDVLHLIDDPEARLTCEVAIHVARSYADGAASEAELAAAWGAAARSASRAASAAAWATAGSPATVRRAAQEAARYAATAAALSSAARVPAGWTAGRTAWVAAMAVTWREPGDAMRDRQSARLMALLGEENR
jgi:hypothetical protein